MRNMHHARQTLTHGTDHDPDTLVSEVLLLLLLFFYFSLNAIPTICPALRLSSDQTWHRSQTKLNVEPDERKKGQVKRNSTVKRGKIGRDQQKIVQREVSRVFPIPLLSRVRHAFPSCEDPDFCESCSLLQSTTRSAAMRYL